jgi:hypothetical protein
VPPCLPLITCIDVIRSGGLRGDRRVQLYVRVWVCVGVRGRQRPRRTGNRHRHVPGPGSGRMTVSHCTRTRTQAARCPCPLPCHCHCCPPYSGPLSSPSSSHSSSHSSTSSRWSVLFFFFFSFHVCEPNHISAHLRQSRSLRKDGDVREFVRVTGATYVPVVTVCIRKPKPSFFQLERGKAVS